MPRTSNACPILWARVLVSLGMLAAGDFLCALGSALDVVGGSCGTLRRVASVSAFAASRAFSTAIAAVAARSTSTPSSRLDARFATSVSSRVLFIISSLFANEGIPPTLSFVV